MHTATATQHMWLTDCRLCGRCWGATACLGHSDGLCLAWQHQPVPFKGDQAFDHIYIRVLRRPAAWAGFESAATLLRVANEHPSRMGKCSMAGGRLQHELLWNNGRQLTAVLL